MFKMGNIHQNKGATATEITLVARRLRSLIRKEVNNPFVGWSLSEDGRIALEHMENIIQSEFDLLDRALSLKDKLVLIDSLKTYLAMVWLNESEGIRNVYQRDER